MQTVWAGWKTLLTPSSEWAHGISAPKAEAEAVIRDVPPHVGAVVRVLRGERCATKAGLLHEWAAALQFPWYFRDNWDSFEECLNDLAWLPARSYVFLITDAAPMLSRDPRDLATFTQILAATNRAMMTGVGTSGRGISPSFRAIFHRDPGGEDDVRLRLEGVGVVLTHLHIIGDADSK